MLAATLKSALDSKGWSARELGRQLDRQPSTVTRWLTGETLPNEDVIKPMATILTLNYDELIEQLVEERETRERKSAFERVEALEERVERVEHLLDEILAELRRPKSNGAKRS